MFDSENKEKQQAKLLGRILDAQDQGLAGLNSLVDDKVDLDPEVLEHLPFVGLLKTVGHQDLLKPESSAKIRNWVERSWQLQRSVKTRQSQRLRWFFATLSGACALFLLIFSILPSGLWYQPTARPFPRAVATSHNNDADYIKLLRSHRKPHPGDHLLRDLREERYQAYITDYTWFKRNQQ